MYILWFAFSVLGPASGPGAADNPVAARPSADRVFWTVEASVPVGLNQPLLGLRLTDVSDGRVGLEGGVSTFLSFLFIGDLGAVWMLPVADGLALLPRIGLSGYLEGGGAAPGVHVGVSALVGGKGLRLRLDYTWRAFLAFPSGISSLGAGVVVPIG